MRSRRLFLWCILVSSVLSPVAADSTSPNDSVQHDFDRFVDFIADGMWMNGRVTTISATPDASDEMLIAAAATRLNKNPGPLTQWHILLKKHMGTADFQAVINKRPSPSFSAADPSSGYLIAIIDSDQGHKIIAIGEREGEFSSGTRWARMYNCDAIFNSPQAGGTPLIRN
jgi:hypothetical protein